MKENKISCPLSILFLYDLYIDGWLFTPSFFRSLSLLKNKKSTLIALQKNTSFSLSFLEPRVYKVANRLLKSNYKNCLLFGAYLVFGIQYFNNDNGHMHYDSHHGYGGAYSWCYISDNYKLFIYNDILSSQKTAFQLTRIIDLMNDWFVQTVQFSFILLSFWWQMTACIRMYDICGAFHR